MARRVVAVTGASAGVGRATARSFGDLGDSVAVIARDQEGLDAAVKEIESAGGTAIAIRADMADAVQVEEAAAHIERELGSLDVWVNNAMTTVFSEFADLDPDEFRRVTDVTYLGTVYGTMSALRRMLPRDRGTIVQVGSALAYRAIPLQSAYCGAKHAIRGFSESLRCELMHRRSGVRISMVQLPALNTPQFDVCRSKMPQLPQPVPPIFQPELAADAVVWVADHPRPEIFVGGRTAATIWGTKVVPRLLDRYLAQKGYDAQQREETSDGDASGNLFDPVDGDLGAHGSFDRETRAGSIFWALSKRLHR
jgi:NAD(P)-dependent dehydrogenase (short-subunit alcohol dehydrogenase family)